MAMSPAMTEAWLSLAQDLGKLRAAWPMGGWSWDNRLSCITSTFGIQFEGEARAAAAMAMPVEWSGASLPKAPPRVRDLAAKYGDVRPGQLLLTGGPIDGLFAFGLWWPWGNGHTISLRVGLADVDSHREPYHRFRDLFGVDVG